MMFDGRAAAQAFADRLLELPRSYVDRTSISGGIDAAVEQLARAPFEAGRRAIDVSGDGTNNSGRDVKYARDEAVALGISINGLVILNSAAAEPRAHKPARRTDEILSQQCNRRAR